MNILKRRVAITRMPASNEAEKIFDSLAYELNFDRQQDCILEDGNLHLESAYSTVRAISGTPLRDSYHLGSTIINDYDRPFEHGFNNYSGISGYASRGRYQIYARGEFQGAPSAAGYSAALAEELSNIDSINFINPATGLPYYQATIPLGPIGTTANVRLLEAYVSANVLNNVVSFGKQDQWLSPAQGGAMAYSNNAENIYAFQINRIEPLRIPGLSTDYRALSVRIPGWAAPGTHRNCARLQPNGSIQAHRGCMLRSSAFVLPRTLSSALSGR